MLDYPVTRHTRLCRNAMLVIPDKRSAIRNPLFSVSSGCRFSPAWRYWMYFCYCGTVSFAGRHCL